MQRMMVFVAAAIALPISCSTEQEIQAKTVNVKLIQVDTVARGSETMKILTWLSQEHVRYTTMVDISQQAEVGSEMTILLRR